jgi:hypothetical protein
MFTALGGVGDSFEVHVENDLINRVQCNVEFAASRLKKPG